MAVPKKKKSLMKRKVKLCYYKKYSYIFYNFCKKCSDIIMPNRLCLCECNKFKNRHFMLFGDK